MGEAIHSERFRNLPNMIDAERSLLGSLFIHPSLFDDTAEILDPEAFYFTAHRSLYAKMVEIRAEGGTLSPVTLRMFANNDPDFSAAGGEQYLVDLLGHDVGPSIATSEAYILVDLARRRDLITVAGFYMERAQTDDQGAESILDDLATEISNLAEKGTSGLPQTAEAQITETLAAVQEGMAYGGKPLGEPTGMVALDGILGGLREGQLLVLAGRPSMGKSALALRIADNLSQGPGGAILFNSMEMTSREIALRRLSIRTRIAFWRIRDGRIGTTEWERIKETAEGLKRSNFHTDDTPALTVGAIKRRAERMSRKRPPKVLVVDYLGLVKPDEARAPRVHQIEQITSGLKACAKTLSTPIILCSQLSRAVEARDDKRPQLSDLRDSGAIEQDADVVLLLSRYERVLENQEPRKRADETDNKFADRYANWKGALARCRGLADVEVAKHRDGKVQNIEMKFDGETMRFDDE